MEPASTGVARREKVSHVAGIGRLVQVVGVAAPFVLYWLGTRLVGPLTGIVGGLTGLFLCPILLFVGARMATTWRCGHCGNRLADKTVEICPTCRAPLK